MYLCLIRTTSLSGSKAECQEQWEDILSSQRHDGSSFLYTLVRSDHLCLGEDGGDVDEADDEQLVVLESTQGRTVTIISVSSEKLANALLFFVNHFEVKKHRMIEKRTMAFSLTLQFGKMVDRKRDKSDGEKKPRPHLSCKAMLTIL